MNHQLAKEFRALRWPWLVGILAAVAATVAGPLYIPAAFFCAAVLGALAFGNEFQYRTLGLLLSQPCPRRELWAAKLIMVGLLAGSVGLVLLAVGHPPPRVGIAVAAAFFVAAVCSAPLWTLVARSTIGGLVFSLASALLVIVIPAQSWAGKLLGGNFPRDVADGSHHESLISMGCLVAGLVYAGVCLYAGWRKFARLELKDAMAGESSILSGAPARREHGWDWLRIRPKGALRNLVRKELRLQRPTLVVAGAFCLCWLAAVALKPSEPGSAYEFLVPLLAGGYIVLAVALAGSISQGEEQTLGLAAWHLTLPISLRRQWLVKLGVGVAVAIGLGLILPGLLSLATLPEARAGLRSSMQADFLLYGLAPILTALWLLFVLSFWGATLLGNALRAVLTGIIGCGALAVCIPLFWWLAEKAGGLEQGLLRDLCIWWQVPVYPAREALPLGFVAFGFLVSLAALGQSRFLFRRPQLPGSAAQTPAALLLAFAFLTALWWADLSVSATSDYMAPPRAEVLQAVQALASTAKQLLDSPSGISLTESDLEKVYPLSAHTQRWLRGAKLTVRSTPTAIPQTELHQRPLRLGPRVLVVFIQFPNGYGFTIGQGGGSGWVVPGHVGQ